MWEVREELGELSEPAPKKITIRAGLKRTRRGCWEKAYRFSSSSAPLVIYPWLSHSWICATPLALTPTPSPVGCFPLILFTHKEILSKSIGWWLRAIMCLLCLKRHKAIWRKPFKIGLKKILVYLGVVSLLSWKIRIKLQSLHNIGLFCLQRCYISKANAIKKYEKFTLDLKRKKKGTISVVEPTDSDQRTERVCNVFLLCPVEGPAALPSIVS